MEFLDPALIAKVLPIIVLINGCLFGLFKILEAIAAFTPSDTDNKIAGWLGKGVTALQKLIDIAGFNPSHKK